MKYNIFQSLKKSPILALGLFLALGSQKLEAQGNPIHSPLGKAPGEQIKGPLNPIDLLQILKLPSLQALEEERGAGRASAPPKPQKSDPLKAYQLFLDRAAYTVFSQFSDPQLRQRLWQLYFDPTHYRYESQQAYQGPSDSAAGAEKLAQASYTSTELLPAGSEPHLLILSDRLMGLPTWSRIYRLQALLELAHQHQWVEALGSAEPAFSPHNYKVFEQANQAYSLWLRYELLGPAPKEALVEELIQAPSVPTRLALGMVYLVDRAQSLSWERFEQNQGPYGRLGDSSEALLKAVKAQAESSAAAKNLSWDQVQALWLEHHHDRLTEDFPLNPKATYQHLRQKLQQLRQSQSPTPDFLMEKALLQALGALTPRLCAAVLSGHPKELQP